MARTIERYYAVRIGKAPSAYFMLGDDDRTPALFVDTKDARAAVLLRKPECPTIVRVHLHDGKRP